MLAAIVAGAVVWDAWRTHRDPLGAYGGRRLVYSVDLDHAWTGGGRGDAGGGAGAAEGSQLVRDTVAVMRARGEAIRWSGRVRASADGDHIEVLLPTTSADPRSAERLRHFLTRSGRLELELVDDGSEVMRRLAEQLAVASDAVTREAVTVETDRWSGPGGGGA